MDKIVLLEYCFMFDPSEAFAHLYQFESELNKFFSERGFDSSVIKYVNGSSGRKIIFLKKKAEVTVSEEVKMPKVVDVQKQLKKIRKEPKSLKRSKDGKYA